MMSQFVHLTFSNTLQECSGYLKRLAIKLLYARQIINDFPQITHDNFPPTDAEIAEVEKEGILLEEVGKAICEMMNSIESKPNRNKSPSHFTGQMTIAPTKEFLENIPLDKSAYFGDLAYICYATAMMTDIFLSHHHRLFLEIKDLPIFKTEPEIEKQIHLVSNGISSMIGMVSDCSMKSGEMLGYWTSQMKIKKQNKENVSLRTKKKKDRIAWLESKIQLGDGEITPNLIITAMSEFGVTQRTVENYLKEIESP